MIWQFRDTCCWVRLTANGPGLRLAYPSSPRLFSERYGYRKPILSLLGFRLFKLKSSPFTQETAQ